MADTKLVDWAEHLIRIEQLTKQVGDDCLHKKYNEAASSIPFIVAELRMLQAAIAIVAEKENGNFK